jgi:hypothetical protein
MTDGPIENTDSAPVEQSADTAQEQTNLSDSTPQAGQENSGNPAWQPILDALPTSLHSQVTPVLQEWDKGVQQRFNAIHEEYAPYKPLKEQGADPETINYALNLVNALNENPEQVWKSMGEYYNLTPAEQAQVKAEQDNQPDWMDNEEYVDPRIAKLEEGVQVMAKVLAEEQQAKAQAAEDARLNQELGDLKEKYGEYDENYVLGRMLNGDSAEDAIKGYQAITEKILAEHNRPAAPKVLGGGGGGVANTSINPAKLSESERRQLAVEMLAKAKQEG